MINLLAGGQVYKLERYSVTARFKIKLATFITNLGQ